MLPHSYQSRITPSIPEHPVGVLGPFSQFRPLNLADSAHNRGIHYLECKSDPLHCLPSFLRLIECGNLIFRRVELGVGARTAREEDQAAAVSLEALDIYGKGFSREVCSPRVNADTDGRGQFSGYFGFLFDGVLATRIPRCHLRVLGLLIEQTSSVVNSRESNLFK